jgi:hypothetical protein
MRSTGGCSTSSVIVFSGYYHIRGDDFKEAFSPVADAVMFCLLIIMQMIFKHKAMIMDVVVAFFIEEGYMECSRGMEQEEGE